MKSTFQGIPKEALAFLDGLAENNNREWFEANKQTYQEKLRKPLEQLCEAVSAELALIAPAYVTEPKRAMFRIYRDTRFSNDKTPYKTSQGALFYRASLGKNEAASFYFEISPKHLGIAGGHYMSPPDVLRAIRVYFLDHHERFEKLIKPAAVVKSVGAILGEKLSRPPKGFPADHPAIEWIKHKQWYFWQELDPALATKPGAVREIVSRFKLMAPVVDFLNEPLELLKKRKGRGLLEL